MAATIGRKVCLFGRVQGVFFRQWTIEQARASKVNGWVRNRSDGSVEARLTGDEESVSNLIEAMRRGPPQARVDDLTIEEVAPDDVEGFSVWL